MANDSVKLSKNLLRMKVSVAVCTDGTVRVLAMC